jgi:hypothetical protein
VYFGQQTVAAGSGEFCLNKSGLWIIKPFSECATFEMEEFLINTTQTSHLDFSTK